MAIDFNKKYYQGRTPKWDSDKFPHSNNVHGKEGARPKIGKYSNPNVSSVTTMDNASCGSMAISPNLQSVVFTKGNVEMHIEIGNITSIETQGSIMTINTEDNIPYYIAFISQSELVMADNRLFSVMNGGTDPGCGYGQGDYSNSDFSSDFN